VKHILSKNKYSSLLDINKKWLDVHYCPGISISNPFLYEWALDLDECHIVTTPIRVNIRDILIMYLSGYKVIHIHWPEHLWRASNQAVAYAKYAYITITIRLAQLIGIRIISSVHNSHPHIPSTPQDNILLHKFYKNSDILVAHSQAAAEYITKSFQNKSVYHPHTKYRTLSCYKEKGCDIEYKNTSNHIKSTIVVTRRNYQDLLKYIQLLPDLNNNIISPNRTTILDKDCVLSPETTQKLVRSGFNVVKDRLSHGELIMFFLETNCVILYFNSNLTSGFANLLESLNITILTDSPFIIKDHINSIEISIDDLFSSNSDKLKKLNLVARTQYIHQRFEVYSASQYRESILSILTMPF